MSKVIKLCEDNQKPETPRGGYVIVSTGKPSDNKPSNSVREIFHSFSFKEAKDFMIDHVCDTTFDYGELFGMMQANWFDNLAREDE